VARVVHLEFVNGGIVKDSMCTRILDSGNSQQKDYSGVRRVTGGELKGRKKRRAPIRHRWLCLLTVVLRQHAPCSVDGFTLNAAILSCHRHVVRVVSK
jgi:hypothetical protein